MKNVYTEVILWKFPSQALLQLVTATVWRIWAVCVQLGLLAAGRIQQASGIQRIWYCAKRK